MRLVTLVDLNAGPLPAVTPPAARNAAWFPIVYQPTPVPPLTGGGSTPVADGVLLEWDAVDSGGAEVIYIIERSLTATGPWDEIARTTETRYLYSDGTGQTWFFRITPSVRGKPGPADVVIGTPELVARQTALDQEAANRLRGDLQTAATAAADASAKANAARDEAVARVDVLAAEIGEIVNAPEWSATESYIAGWLVRQSGNLYRAKAANINKQPTTNPATWEYIGQFASAAEAAAAALQLATATANEVEAEALKISSMQARMPSGTGQLETKARVDQVDQARADGDAGLASSISSVSTATGNAQSTASNALVAANNAAGAATTAQNTANGAQSTATNALTVSNANASAITQVRREIGGSGNLLPNSSFESDLQGWSVQVNGWSSSPGRNYAGDNWVPFGGAQVGWSASEAPGGVVVYISPVMTAEVGKCYVFSGLSGAHRCSTFLRLIFVDSNGDEIGVPQSTEANTSQKSGGKNLVDWMRLWKQSQAPAGTMGMRLQLWSNSATAANPYAFFTRLMVEEVPAERTIPSEWSVSAAGVDAKYATATNMLSVGIDGVDGRLKAKQTISTDVNGNIAGYVSENDGSRSSFSILATVFRVISSLAGMGMEWQDGYLRIWKGSAQLLLGHSFGSGDLVMWYGPNVGAGSCTKSNSLFHLDTTGGGYFGGSLSAGTLKNAVQTTTTVTTGTELINGPFDTNGNTRSVVLSFTRTMAYVSNAFGSSGFTAGAGANTATIQLYRKIGTAAEALWQTLNVSGSIDILNEFDGPDRANSRWGGALTVNDTSPAGQQVTYRAVITGYTSQAVTHPGTINSITTSQNLAVIATEQ